MSFAFIPSQDLARLTIISVAGKTRLKKGRQSATGAHRMWFKSSIGLLARRRTSVLCSAISVLLCLVAPVAHSACHSFTAIDVPASKPVVYQGSVGDQKVRIALWVSGGRRAEGFGGYAASEDQVGLDGTFAKDDDSLVLRETDSAGKSEGTFKLKFDVPVGLYDDGRDLAAYDCSYLVGTWVGRGDRNPRVVILNRDARLNEAYKAERELNERAAFLMQAAILRGRSQDLEPLLAYPVSTQGITRGGQSWDDASDLKRDFKALVSAKRGDATSAVAHALLSGPASTYFWDGSVCLSHGRITQICRSGCKGGCP